MKTKTILKNLVTQAGGTPTAKSVKGLTEQILKAQNDLWNITLDTDIDSGTAADLLGKSMDDLQENVVVKGDKICGHLFYVTGYTGFSGLVSEQSGNYLVTHVSVPDVEGVTFTVSKNGGTPKAMDSDGILITRIPDPANPGDVTLTFTASKTSLVSATKTFNLRGIVCDKA